MQDTQKVQKVVDTLLKKASETQDSGDALRFSQAAVNAANAKNAMAFNHDNE